MSRGGIVKRSTKKKLPKAVFDSPDQALVQVRFRKNAWILGAAVLVISILFLLVRHSTEKRQAFEDENPSAASPDATIEKFHLISTALAEKHWELYATSAKLYQNLKQADTDDIFAEYYKHNRMVSNLTADEAVINTETNATLVSGHVELITENGSKLETEKLAWDPDTDMIHTDEKVHVFKGSDDITAVGLVADTELNNVQFTKDVHTQVRDTNEVENFNRPKPF
jgi:LPS export ABC transporter protein LptC